MGDALANEVQLNTPGRVGGVPYLPMDFDAPRSILSGEPMQFVFQIAFPECHVLHGYTAAMFLAIDEIREDLVIPPLSCGELARMSVDKAKLIEQQALHGAFLFHQDKLMPRHDLLSPVQARALVPAAADDAYLPFGCIADDPEWLLGDETPRPLDHRYPSVFCFSTVQGLLLPVIAGSPPQVVVDFLSPDQRASRRETYGMFAGNAAYYFAYPGAEQLISVVVQGD
ncbi:hypothetical protein [Rhizobium oryzicola]|uniref:Uncharacterized protein n=1 Tax=Rhizobium oryzicola TaxID=1232668 RepID=A0ABT8SSX4_9HYPH|nr:hypothetical protein [Rhizobium oryzicola]MDO1581520.1 hypothetical protein [Rhizobium oryzicola]